MKGARTKGGRSSAESTSVPEAHAAPPPRTPGAQARGVARAAGNQAMQRLVQAKLRVGAASDPLEREADEVASCPECAPGAPCSCSGRRISRQANAGAGGSERWVDEGRMRGLGPGAPLDDRTRVRMESRLAHDFSGVRVHEGGEASRTAAALDARAFTVGSDIVFADGEHQPATGEGQQLLAHELTHVVQQSGSAPAIQRVLGEGEEAVLGPCDVDEISLSNASLVEYFRRAQTYLDGHGKDRAWFDWRNLYRRLFAERERRAGMGHSWLGGDLSGGIPATLYELRAGLDFMVQVLPADVEVERGAPFDHGGQVFVLSAAQFQLFLARHGIPSVDPDAFYEQVCAVKEKTDPLTLLLPPPSPAEPMRVDPLSSPRPHQRNQLFSPLAHVRRPQDDLPWPSVSSSIVAGGQMYMSPYEWSARPYISQQVYSENVDMSNSRSVSGAEANWRGPLAEMSTANQTWFDHFFRYQDLNKLTKARNTPGLDILDRVTRNYIQATNSLQGDKRAMAAYDRKFLDMIGMEVRRTGVVRTTPQMTKAIALLNDSFDGEATILDVAGNVILTVNDDHVDLYKPHLRQKVTAHPERYANLIDHYLRDEPISAQEGTLKLSTWNEVQAARSAGTYSEAEFSRWLAGFSEKATSHVMSNNLTTDELNRRQQYRIGTQSLTPDEFRAQVPLELQEASGVGTGATVHRSGVRGMKAGAGMAALLETGQLIFTDRKLDWHYPTNIALGGAGGYVASSIESSIVSATAAPLVGNAGELAGLGRFGGRLVGATFGGAIAAPAVTTAAMGLEELVTDVDYTYIDYAARGGRALVAGGAAAGAGTAAVASASALTSMATGAAAGTELGPIGWLIGGGVGLLVYWLVDHAVGEDVEEGIRDSLGDQGCLPEAEIDYLGEGVYDNDYERW